MVKLVSNTKSIKSFSSLSIGSGLGITNMSFSSIALANDGIHRLLVLRGEIVTFTVDFGVLNYVVAGNKSGSSGPQLFGQLLDHFTSLSTLVSYRSGLPDEPYRLGIFLYPFTDVIGSIHGLILRKPRYKFLRLYHRGLAWQPPQTTSPSTS
jgi:hypothetical protein